MDAITTLYPDENLALWAWLEHASSVLETEILPLNDQSAI